MLDALQSATQPTLGGRFGHLCIVGLNQVELINERTGESIFAENWQDITDEQIRKRMALIFCAPRELDGQPMNPYLYLVEDAEDSEDITVAQQNLSGVPLVDLGRLPKAAPGEVHMLIAADMLLHWDNRDVFVLPTTKFSWLRDIEALRKEYPKNTTYQLYTNWDPDKTGQLDLERKSPRQCPLYKECWLNEPTLQEKFGTWILLISLLVAAGTYGMLHLQWQHLDRLAEQVRIVQQRIPREGRYQQLAQLLTEQEKFLHYRALFPTLVQDAARSIQLSQMQIENFSLENPTPTEPNDYLILSIEAQRDVYRGWLQEEPVAKRILINSAGLMAIRKPPGNTFKLEGLIDLKQTHKNFTLSKAEFDGIHAALATTTATAALSPTQTSAEVTAEMDGPTP